MACGLPDAAMTIGRSRAGGLTWLWNNIGGGYGRLALTGLDNLRVFVTGRRPRRGPVFVGWDISHRCTLSCRHCDRWTRRDHSRELSRDEKLSLARNLGDGGVWAVSLSGGEPLECPDLEDVVSLLHRRGVLVNVCTNGLAIRQQSDFLLSGMVESVTISVEGHDAESHESVRRRSDAFDDVLSGIETLRARRRRKPRINVRTVVTGESWRRLPSFVAFWRTRADQILFQPFIDGHIRSGTIPDSMRIRSEDGEDLARLFEQLFVEYPELDHPYHRGIPAFLTGVGDRAVDHHCFAGTFFAEITPEGDVFSCSKCHELLGACRQTPFSTLWKADGCRDFRRRHRRHNVCDCYYNSTMLNIHLSALLRPLLAGATSRP